MRSRVTKAQCRSCTFTWNTTSKSVDDGQAFCPNGCGIHAGHALGYPLEKPVELGVAEKKEAGDKMTRLEKVLYVRSTQGLGLKEALAYLASIGNDFEGPWIERPTA